MRLIKFVLVLSTNCASVTSIVTHSFSLSSVIVPAFDIICFASGHKLCLRNQYSCTHIFAQFSSLALDRICFASEHKLCPCNQYSYLYIFSQFSSLALDRICFASEHKLCLCNQYSYLYIFSRFSLVIVRLFDRICFASEHKLCLCNQYSCTHIFSRFSSVIVLAFDRICFASERKPCLCEITGHQLLLTQVPRLAPPGLFNAETARATCKQWRYVVLEMEQSPQRASRVPVT